MKVSDSLVQQISQGYFEGNETLYEMMSSHQGIEQFTQLVRNVYDKTQEECIKTVPTPINRQVRSSQSKSQFQQIQARKTIIEDPGQIQLDLFQFMNLFDDFLSEMMESSIMDWFQLLQQNEKVRIRDLFIVVLLFASKESKQQIEYIYNFGEYLFDCLKQQNNKLLGLTLRCFAKLYGINARQCQRIFNDLKIKNSEEYSFEDMEVFCFAILNPDYAPQTRERPKQYQPNKSEGATRFKFEKPYL